MTFQRLIPQFGECQSRKDCANRCLQQRFQKRKKKNLMWFGSPRFACTSTRIDGEHDVLSKTPRQQFLVHDEGDHSECIQIRGTLPISRCLISFAILSVVSLWFSYRLWPRIVSIFLAVGYTQLALPARGMYTPRLCILGPLGITRRCTIFAAVRTSLQ